MTMDLHRPVDISLDLNCDKQISPLYFGDNLEHTRDCINSGISAQMLKNRKFVGKPSRLGCALGWYRIGERASFAFSQDVYTKHHEDYRMVRAHECNAQRITGFVPGEAGIGQGELSVAAGIPYAFALVAKSFAPLSLQVRLTGSDGQLLAGASLTAEPGDYKRCEAVLVPTAGDDDARLEIVFDGPGTLTLGAVSLMREDHFHGMRRDVIERMKELGIRLLRWPGGNFSGEYNWKDGLLPRDQRAPFQSYLWLETQPHTWGYDFHEISTDDFLALCEELGAEAFITTNPTWYTPQCSGQWVEYCNGDVSTPYGALRAKNGHPKPYNVKIWSLGNELGYGHMEGANRAADYARVVREHGLKMLAADPEITLCSCGPYPNEEWARDSANPLGDISKLVSLHHYPHYPDYIDPAAREQEYYRFISTPDTEFLPLMQKLRAQLDDRVAISLDEWNAWVAWYRPGSISEGIFAARFINMVLMEGEKNGIRQVCHFESCNEGAILVTPKDAQLTPAGNAIAAMSIHAGGRICALEDDVVATRKDGLLTVTLVNRSYGKEKQFTLPLAGRLISGKLLAGEDVLPYSRFTASELSVRETEEALKLLLPAHSIAVIRIELAQ